MKKKKKHCAQPLILKQNLSNECKTKFDEVARMMLSHFGLSPDLYDSFNQYQKNELRHSTFSPPTVMNEKGNDVPRQFVRRIRTDFLVYLANQYFGDPKNGIKYMDIVIYGFAFILFMNHIKEQWSGVKTCGIRNNVDEICEVINPYLIVEDQEMRFIFSWIEVLLMEFSQFNFREYGYNFEYILDKTAKRRVPTFRFVISINSTNRVSRHISHNNISRKVYQLSLPRNAFHDFVPARFSKTEVLGESDVEGYFEFYIQSHVIHRVKERVDLFNPRHRNCLIKTSILYGPQFITFNGQHYITCLYSNLLIGYFPFFIQNDYLIISTFLPFISKNTPMGSKFHTILPLSNEEMKYLGMDKISFYLKIDFEQIPLLKQALVESGIWDNINKMNDLPMLSNKVIDQESTLFVKHFFDKHEKYCNMNV